MPICNNIDFCNILWFGARKGVKVNKHFDEIELVCSECRVLLCYNNTRFVLKWLAIGLGFIMTYLPLPYTACVINVIDIIFNFNSLNYINLKLTSFIFHFSSERCIIFLKENINVVDQYKILLITKQKCPGRSIEPRLVVLH